MRLKKTLLFLALCASLSRAAISVALCGTPDDPGATSVSSLTVTCTPTTGAYLVIFSVTSSSGTQTITDTNSNTFVVPSLTNLAGFPNWHSTSGSYNVWVVVSANAGSTTITVTNNAASSFNSLTVMQITGLISPSPDCGNNALNSQPASIVCTVSGADALVSMVNRYAAPGATTISGTQLFQSTGSGAATAWSRTTMSGSFGLAWNFGGNNGDTFLLAVKGSSAVTQKAKLIGFQ